MQQPPVGLIAIALVPDVIKSIMVSFISLEGRSRMRVPNGHKMGQPMEMICPQGNQTQ
jgi:hypothetical protein